MSQIARNVLTAEPLIQIACLVLQIYSEAFVIVSVLSYHERAIIIEGW
jgi:hypothetical protein